MCALLPNGAKECLNHVQNYAMLEKCSIQTRVCV